MVLQHLNSRAKSQSFRHGVARQPAFGEEGRFALVSRGPHHPRRLHASQDGSKGDISGKVVANLTRSQPYDHCQLRH